MKKICELFDTFSGNDLALSYLNLNDNGIAYVSRTEKNNGITARIDEIESIKPFPAGTISVSLGGSVLEAFLHEEPYYTGYHIKILKPKTDMSTNVLQFYCYCIRLNKFKYSFGRQANKTIDDILVPDINEIPNWVEKKRDIDINSIPEYFLDEGYEKACWYLDNVDQETFEKEYSKSVLKESIKIEYEKWQFFKLCGEDGIFDADHGTRLKSIDRIEGDIPLITAGKINQGITTYIQENPKMKLFEKCITIDMFGNSFYHTEKFYCDDNIVTLKPKNDISNYCCQFISIVLNNEKYRYSFGRQYRKTKYSDNQLIFLPAIYCNGNFAPDFKYMEKFIKSLPYGGAV